MKTRNTAQTEQAILCPKVDSACLGSLEWRCIGPYRGGRVVAVAGDPKDSLVFYFGACAGGVWKTEDGGTYWENVSDGFFKTSAVGAIAVSESDPNVIYAGMGECCIRLDISHGDGVYGSRDGGRTWTHLGLEDTRYIARVRIHPKDPDLVYAAALGHVFGPNRERGIYRSRNGGKTWEQVLFRSEKAGGCDLAMDPNNPDVLYAAIWEAYRKPWFLSSGGPDSGLFKSTDGGDTWVELTGNPGLPEGIKGRMGVAVSPARPGRVWAIVEAEKGAFFRSDDWGATWERLTEDKNLRERPFYYCHVFGDPQDADTVYVLSKLAWKSSDGGYSFTQLNTPHNDNHDLWLDPHTPRRMIEGNDGGACVSFNGGETWSTIYNQPTAQFYHVAADMQVPYSIYGTQQDNTAIGVPSRSDRGAILIDDCRPVGNAESGHIAVRPDDPNVVYSGAIGSSGGGGGALLRYDHRSKQIRVITAWPESFAEGAKALKYRFQWTFPIAISPHDPHILYTTSQVVLRSATDGDGWEVISPDLTRNDVAKMEPSGGPITKDAHGAENYCTIFAFAESPLEQGVLWAGSDDGLIHISRNNGVSWENVTPEDLPEWTTVGIIEPSPHDPATAYVAAYRYKLDDFQPYLYKTNDYGKRWEKITGGIPEQEFTRVIREDPGRRGLLYAGTETGVYVSFDAGKSWQSLQRNLPVAPIYDLLVKDNDLVAATHGRSFWILDDLTLLHQMTEAAVNAPVHLFRPRSTYRFLPAQGYGRPSVPGKNYRVASGVLASYYEKKTPEGKTVQVLLDAGKNPPDGVVVTYFLKEKPEGEVKLSFLDAEGVPIKTFSSRAADDPQADSKETLVPSEVGMNRFEWDMQYPGERTVSGGGVMGQNPAGPLVPPGTYQIRLKVGDESHTESFQLLKDPRVPATQEDLEAQFALLVKIRDKLSEFNEVVGQVRRVQKQVAEWERRAKDLPDAAAVSEAAKALGEKLAEVDLKTQLGMLTAPAAQADAAPTKQVCEAFEEMSAAADQQIVQGKEMIETDVVAFSKLIRETDIPAIVLK